MDDDIAVGDRLNDNLVIQYDEMVQHLVVQIIDGDYGACIEWSNPIEVRLRDAQIFPRCLWTVVSK